MREMTISPSELQVMRVLWAHPGATSAYIIDQLGSVYGWQAVTIKTLLGRLKNKGLVQVQKQEGKYRYHATMGEEEELKRGVDTLLASLCNTKHAELVALFLESGHFSKADLSTLADLIEAKQAQAPDRLICHCIKGQCTCGQEC